MPVLNKILNDRTIFLIKYSDCIEKQRPFTFRALCNLIFIHINNINIEKNYPKRDKDHLILLERFLNELGVTTVHPSEDQVRDFL